MKLVEIALVGRPGSARLQLAAYLRADGFAVRECRDTAIPRTADGVVVVDEQGAAASLRRRVQAWLAEVAKRRVVVVSTRPTAWKELVADHAARLVVLAAPVFGWVIVDALRPPAG